MSFVKSIQSLRPGDEMRVQVLVGKTAVDLMIYNSDKDFKIYVAFVGDECMQLQINYGNIYVYSLAYYSACGSTVQSLAQQSGLSLGNFMLACVDVLAEELGSDYATLYDASTKQVCTEKLSLTVLRSLMSGAGWYASQGYVPDYCGSNDLKNCDLEFNLEQSLRLSIIENEYIDMLRALTPTVMVNTLVGLNPMLAVALGDEAITMGNHEVVFSAIFTKEFGAQTLANPTGPECKFLVSVINAIKALAKANVQPYAAACNQEHERIKFYKTALPPSTPDLADPWQPDFHAPHPPARLCTCRV